ncbi:hypothetical protein J008_04596 [Cryptococcus neoformans]|nr:hypothetical protein C362_04126 [Cryptococcus neoformans var. grubii Bt1]OXG19098.1 hypothetical protein C367_04542 [Cryptococcus neoformans var. grubii Ze90-1]OXH28074.1 hypothetical protein J008_04596 [Cryptococcus neoformans var. grubii]OXM77753.1 hypothetical protein C364_04693 [Cryptococcus neoformans var. grubii Bt63]
MMINLLSEGTMAMSDNHYHQYRISVVASRVD